MKVQRTVAAAGGGSYTLEHVRECVDLAMSRHLWGRVLGLKIVYAK